MKNNTIKNRKFNDQIPKVNCQLSIVNCRQKGVSLIITFLIMTIMLAIILSISVILFSEIKIVSNLGNSVSALYSSESGLEKTLYLDRKQVPNGSSRGVCSICSTCSSGQGIGYCNSCTATPLDGGSGCDPLNCVNCEVKYSSDFDNRNYTIDATIAPVPPAGSNLFSISSRGLYQDTTRVVQATVTGSLQ